MDPPLPGETRELENWQGRRFRLPYERWDHIRESHSNMSYNFGAMVEALRYPDAIVVNGNNPDTHVYHKEIEQVRIGLAKQVPFKGYMAVFVNERQAFVITAFPMKKLKRGHVLWRR